jgi:hypothetical protein
MKVEEQLEKERVLRVLKQASAAGCGENVVWRKRGG